MEKKKIKEKDKKFFLGILEFYEKFLESTSDSIRKLAEIQKNNKERYEKFKDLSYDTDKIVEMIGGLDEEDRGIFLEMLLRTQSFQKRMGNLFDLSAEEQNKLANDLDEFIKYMKKKLKERMSEENE